MSIFSGSRYETVSEFTPVVNRIDGRTRNFLHNRRVFRKDEVKGEFSTHVVVGDQLIDHIAFIYYGDERLWWLIADVNELDYAWGLKPGQVLTIPPKDIIRNING